MCVLPDAGNVAGRGLDERQSDRVLSPHTGTAYRNDLRVLAEHVAGPAELPPLHRLTVAELTTSAIRGASGISKPLLANETSHPEHPLIGRFGSSIAVCA